AQTPLQGQQQNPQNIDQRELQLESSTQSENTNKSDQNMTHLSESEVFIKNEQSAIPSTVVPTINSSSESKESDKRNEENHNHPELYENVKSEGISESNNHDNGNNAPATENTQRT